MVLVALMAGGSVARVVADAEAASQAWAHGTRVVIAARDLPVGAVVRPNDVLVVERPRRLVPAGALSQLAEGQVVRTAVFEGEALVGERLAPSGLSAIAAALPVGTRAVAIPVEAETSPPLQAGDLVDVLVALPEEAAGDGPPGFTLATDVLVVDVADHAVTVAVDPEVAPRVAVALGHGAVTLALVGA